MTSGEAAKIAIVGMACRMPGAAGVAEFWRNLSAGVESIRRLSRDEMLAAGATPEDIDDPRHVPFGALIDDVDGFDASFFGVTGREAELMDPQQRVLLECAWQALEDAGHDPTRDTSPVGVFAGANFNTYLSWNLLPAGVFDDKAAVLQAVLANDKDYLATRIAYKLDLHGPAYAVQSGCSTSLVAVHLACRSLLSYECDVALAGGVAIDVERGRGYWAHEGSVFSPDGHCRAFDADAKGTVFGNGAGLVVLKRLEDALRDGNTVHAVVLGSAVNNDGSLKVGFTAPSVSGQSEVITEALGDAGVSPDSIGYVEAHGTGTPLGDPVEVEALRRAFGPGVPGRCAIGSVKTNVGHLDTAAGVAGLIKAVLALRHGLIPPSLHFSTLNPKIDFRHSPFYVNASPRPWTSGTTPGTPRRAGVSAFGMGGTNVHIVLEEAPEPPSEPASRSTELLVWSARTPEALEDATRNLQRCLRERADTPLADIAYTLQVGRTAFACRRTLVADSTEAAAAALDGDARTAVRTHRYSGESPKVAFLFPGQGSQYAGMGRELYESEPVFREQLEACRQDLREATGLDLSSVLYAESGGTPSALVDTDLTQPVLFAVEYALSQLWISWGVEPAALLGHSLGEYAAACLAGVFSRRDAMRIVARRGQLMQGLPAGAMTAVFTAPDALDLDPGLALAAVNAPGVCVASGRVDDIDQFERRLAASGIEYRRLQTTRAFHSALVDPIVAPFVAEMADVRLSPPAIPFVSNVSGRWIEAGEATDPRYWGEHLRCTVRFADGLRSLGDRDAYHLLEVGPGRTLTGLAGPQYAHAGRLLLGSLPAAGAKDSSQQTVLDALGRLWQAGTPIDWSRVHGQRRRRRVALPVYPFERARYWIDPPPEDDGAEVFRKHEDVGRWFYVPAWKQVPPVDLGPPPPAVPADGPWLVLADDSARAAAIVAALARRLSPDDLVVVRPGDRFERLTAREYAINPATDDDYARLVNGLAGEGLRPVAVAHLWGLSCGDPESTTRESIARDNQAVFYACVNVLQALERLQPTRPLSFRVVTANAHDVLGTETLSPASALPLALARVVPQERPHVDWVCVDVDRADLHVDRLDALARRVAAGLTSPGANRFVALRGPSWYVPTYEPVRLRTPAATAPLRTGGTYVIVGGLGRIGLTVAAHLASRVPARLVLVGRTGLPPRSEWRERLAHGGDADPVCQRIRQVEHVEGLGAEVMVVAADAGEESDLRRVFDQAERRFGAVNGVVMAAGLVDPASFKGIMAVTPADCERQFRAKIDGAFALEAALGDRPVDFCLVVSSLSSVLGGLGYAAYAAANTFLDAFVHRHNRRHPVRWLSVNWDAWRWRDVPADAPEGSLLRLAMSPTEAMDALDRVLAVRGVDQVVVSTIDLSVRLDQWMGSAATEPEPESVPVPAPSGESQPRTERDQPALTATEQAVVDVWRKVLGVERIELNESFLDLGGNSLTAVETISRLEAVLGVHVAIEEFIFQTARQLATLCDRKLQARQAEKPADEPRSGGLLRTLRAAVGKR